MADAVTRMKKAELQTALEQYTAMLPREQLLEARARMHAKRDQLAREGATREVDWRLQGVVAGIDLALGNLPLDYFT